MDLLAERGRRVTVDELNTTRLLAHARKQAVQRKLDDMYVRSREFQGRILSYIEGWHAIAEANRIFGFDGWNRETLESRCILARDNRGTFNARPGAALVHNGIGKMLTFNNTGTLNPGDAPPPTAALTREKL